MKSLIGTMQSPLLHVFPNRCLMVRNRNASCLRCAEVCTSKAITITEGNLVVDQKKCIGCGTCASACPTGCLEAASPSDDKLFESVNRALHATPEKQLTFACEQAFGYKNPGELFEDTYTHEPVITLTCLGRVDEALLIQSVAQGASLIKLTSGTCETCLHHKGGRLCKDIEASARALLDGLGKVAPFERVEVEPGSMRLRLIEDQNKNTSTAAAIQAANKQANPSAPSSKKAAQRARSADGSFGHISATIVRNKKPQNPYYEHVQQDGTLAHHLPERRLRLYNSLKALGTPKEHTVTTRVWGQVYIDTDLCRSCRMCTVFCPTGALRSGGESKDALYLEHRSSLCTQCKTCESICPENAIHVSDTVDYDDFLKGTKQHIELPPVGWNPGEKDAIATRMSRFLKVSNYQDPQAGIKPEESIKQQAYMKERDRVRAEKKKTTKMTGEESF
jgi:ferredoxin/coenzyme F420-reducing hydrogenase delta subunit